MKQEFTHSVPTNLKKMGINCIDMCSLWHTSILNNKAELVDKLGMCMNTSQIHWQGTILDIYKN